jgi:CubicO group peptidase (beta-lactamase class C family)
MPTPQRIIGRASPRALLVSTLLLAGGPLLQAQNAPVSSSAASLPSYGGPIALRHLLGHTSGLRDFFELLILARGRFEEERITDADAMAVIARQRGVNFAAGAEYGYSNTNYLLAAHVVERVSGERFADFVRKRVFTPLGMTHSRWRDDAAVRIPRNAVGYTKDLLRV